MKLELSWGGENVFLGQLFSSSANIKAFGPETLPLCGVKTFGIRQVTDHLGCWSSPIHAPEVWFETKVVQTLTQVELSFSFVGLTKEKPLALSFYVQANQAKVGEKNIEKGTIRRYSGSVVPILFDETLQLLNIGSHRMEVIPISGDNSFWNSDYLIAFELAQPSVIIKVSSLEK